VEALLHDRVFLQVYSVSKKDTFGEWVMGVKLTSGRTIGFLQVIIKKS
jgi:hypothetical protein